MKDSISREHAIERLAQHSVAQMSAGERLNRLETIMCEYWAWGSDPNWCRVPVDVQIELADPDSQINNPADSRYELPLLLHSREDFVGAANAFLLTQLADLGYCYEDVVGDDPVLEPCPCCGLQTLTERGHYDICGVCWWEDDGQDNDDADRVVGGPNYHLSLTQGRINFLTTGIYDPDRKDLRARQDRVDKYLCGRVFELGEDGRSVCEPASGWHGRAVKK